MPAATRVGGTETPKRMGPHQEVSNDNIVSPFDSSVSHANESG